MARFPRIIGPLAALITYGLGVWWRFRYIVKQHDPRDYIYSDMNMYMRMAKNTLKPDFVAGPLDVSHPPGMSGTIAWFLQYDESLQQLVNLQFGLSCLVPFAVAALGLAAFGRKTAWWGLAISSLYFPFIDYAGFFLAEIYMMVLIPLTMALFIWANELETRWARVLCGVLTGCTFSVAFAFKMVALPTLLGFAGLYFLFARGPSWATKTVAIGLMVLVSIPTGVRMAKHCTEATGFFCVGSNKSGADFLMGHFGRVRSITWAPENGGRRRFGSPSAVQHGYKIRKTVPFSLTDRKNNMATAKEWIRGHKFESLVLSVEHVTDAFGATFPWPSVATNWWAVSQGTQYAFLLLLLLPGLVRLLDIWRESSLLELLRSRELIVISPIFGLALAVFIATGEARYRIPFDSVAILVGIQFYLRFTDRRVRPDVPPIEEQEPDEGIDEETDEIGTDPGPVVDLEPEPSLG